MQLGHQMISKHCLHEHSGWMVSGRTAQGSLNKAGGAGGLFPVTNIVSKTGRGAKAKEGRECGRFPANSNLW